jgi:hypothetical protein
LSGAPDRDRAKTRPFLIAKDEAGSYRLTVRETRFNSQNFPVVTATLVDERFETATAARNYAKEKYGAVAGEFANK